MPEKRTIERAKEDLREGKRPSTAAGEFVREEMEHVERGKHGVRSRKQAIAIGLSKARRSGIPLPPRPRAGTRKRPSAQAASRAGRGKRSAGTSRGRKTSGARRRSGSARRSRR